MNRVAVNCPHCARPYRVEETLLGKKARCARCRQLFRLARADDAAVLASSPWPWVSQPRSTPIGSRPRSGGDSGWHVGDIVLNLYEVRDVFTSGGMGLVYRVRHRGWNVELAVKCPRPEFFRVELDKDNFEREAETWVKLAPHPHAVACHYVRRVGDIPHVFAEFVGGGSLADWVRDGRLYAGGADASLARVLDIAIQFARGLDHAHKEGLVHRDVKPGNVLLTEGGVAKVTDFGMARALGGTLGDTADTLVSAGGLTPAFCSPEQVRGEPLARATDVWSWGVSVLEMFAGPATWSAGYLAADVLADYLGRPTPPGLPPMPKGVADLLRRCFRRETGQRPADMVEIADALRDVYRNTTGSAYPRPVPPSAEALPDALNNRAVSLLDLNKKDEAEELWRKALAAGPGHPEATYNLGLLQWRDGRLSDAGLVTRLYEMAASHPGRWLPPYLLAGALMELCDWRGAVAVLSDIGAGAKLDEVRAALALARSRVEGAGKLVRRYDGHEDWVSSVSLATNVALGLSGGADRTVRLWEVATGRCLRVLTGHADWVTGVALSADGRRALSGGADGTLRVWDTLAGTCLRVVETGGRWVLTVALSADGRRALVGDGIGLVSLWDLDGGQRLAALAGHDGAVLNVALAPDGRRGLSGGRDGTARLWDLEKGVSAGALIGHGDKVHAVALSGDGRLALSASADQTLRLWDVDKLFCIRELSGHDGPVFGAALSADGAYALSGGNDRTVRLWRLAQGRCLTVLEGHAAGVGGVALDASGRFALSASGDRTLALWRLPADVRAPYLLARVLPSETLLSDWAEFERKLDRAWQALASGDAAAAARRVRAARALPGRARQREALDRWMSLYLLLPRVGLDGGWEQATWEAHLGAATAVAVADDGRLALSGGADGALKVWDVALGQALRVFDAEGTVVTAAAVGPKAHFALSGGADGYLHFWDLDGGRSRRTLGAHADVVAAAAASPDGRRVLSAGADAAVCVWDLDGRLRRRLDGADGPVHAAAWAPDGRTVVAGGGAFLVRGGERLFTSGFLRMWDVDTGRCRHAFGGHDVAVTALALSLDGRVLLTGGGRADHDATTGKATPAPGPLHLWDVASGRCLAEWPGHAGAVTAVALTGDGRFAFSAGTDGVVKAWDATTGRCLRSFAGHTDAVTCLALARDGRFVLSGGADRTLKLWLLDWRLEERSAADWDEGARPYLEAFVASRRAVPWNDEDFEALLETLGAAGYGVLRPDGVRAVLTPLLR